MIYSVELTNSARRDFAALESDVAQRVGVALEGLRTNPRPNGSIKLADEKGAYRVRVGTHRIKYHVDDAIRRVLVTKIQHRREVYR
jgi:mRNA interferase RelE/StbE